jgi:hypothetical protein
MIIFKNKSTKKLILKKQKYNNRNQKSAAFLFGIFQKTRLILFAVQNTEPNSLEQFEKMLSNQIPSLCFYKRKKLQKLKDLYHIRFSFIFFNFGIFRKKKDKIDFDLICSQKRLSFL